ncbi:MAG TPA: ATP-dependent DNA helicase [Steroidobacteraceae bacterium]|nr:ATP-dependent DNA helicase [Steroidobacteraceae bacterium]
MLELEDIFGEGGPLQRALPGFNVRRQQVHMAGRVAAALAGREILTVEAGTGTGKTFAYLVPALLSGARVLVSTGTRTLQDQLYAKDLPLVGAALGRPAKVALLKGRSNYLCRHRLEQAGAARGDMLERIRSWSRTTRSGDLAEVGGLADSHPVWAQVTSTRDNCLGARCPQLAGCHVALARRHALDADIVIVNHHLLLADLALKEDGFGDLLGAADAIILDEAHQIPDLAAQFFGAQVSSRRIESLLEAVQVKLAKAGVLTPDAHAHAVSAVREVQSGVAQIRAAIAGGVGRITWTEADTPIAAAVRDLGAAVAALAAALRAAGEETAVRALGERASELAASLERIAAVGELEGARSVEITPSSGELPLAQAGFAAGPFALSLLPFDIAARFQALIAAHPCSWVFTSATLSLGEDFSPFTGRLGLDGCATLKIDSPFDYPRQSLLYLPPHMPLPTAPQFLPAVIEVALELIDAARGGAFVLFTSHRALAAAAALWRQQRARTASYRLLVQGEAPREQLLREFREDGSAVLLGTTSFWEGVDVKGSALRLVVIEKLPFASPDDPLVRARVEHLEAAGRSAFREYQLPEAALALKQGVGRLIRSEDDFGAVAICDPRLTGRGYGKVFLAALPPMTVTREQQAAVDFLVRHAPAAAEVCRRGRGQ